MNRDVYATQGSNASSIGILQARAQSLSANAAGGTRSISLVREVTGQTGEGYLHSMLSSGKPQLLLSVAGDWLRRSGDCRRLRACAASAGVAAAWRVGDWPRAKQFLKV